MMMNTALRGSLKMIARMIPLDVYPGIIKRESLDFFFHVVSDRDLPYVRHLYPVIPVSRFEDALDVISSHFHWIDYQRLEDARLKGKPLPSGAVHLSFDDGYAAIFHIVRPILLERQIPCTFFLTTNLLDNRMLFYRNKVSLCIDAILQRKNNPEQVIAYAGEYSNNPVVSPGAVVDWLKSLRLPDEKIIDGMCELLGIDPVQFLKQTSPYLTSEQVRQLHDDGFTIGAHTMSHRKLGTLPPDEAEKEIVRSCEIIRQITGQASVPLSFPHSGAGLDRKMLMAIREKHPWIGLFFDTKGVRKDIPIVVNRIWAERPIKTRGYIEPIPDLLKNAYEEEFVEAMLSRIRRLVKRQ